MTKGKTDRTGVVNSCPGLVGASGGAGNNYRITILISPGFPRSCWAEFMLMVRLVVLVTLGQVEIPTASSSTGLIMTDNE